MSTETPPVERTGVGSISELQALLDGFDAAMLVTSSLAGGLRARPLALERGAPLADCDLWFVTAADPSRTDELERDHRITLCVVRARDQAWVTLTGTARVSRDPGLVQRLWRPEWRIWFADAARTDGEIAILKVTVDEAAYWRPEGGRLRVLYRRAGAADEDLADILPPKR